MGKLITLITVALYATAMLFLAVTLPMPVFMGLSLFIIIMAVIYGVEVKHDKQ